MRQILVRVPRGHGSRVLQAARRRGGSDLSVAEVTSERGEPLDLAILYVSNSSAGPLLAELQDIPDLHVSMIPSSALALRPPLSAIAAEVRDVTARSPFEIYLAGLQSIGGWAGFLGYAVAGGVVVWLGLSFDSVVLLVGAMLIAPFAGPAMNTAIATARGDGRLLWRALVRYTAALVVTAAVAALLTAAFQQDVVTRQMEAISRVSAATVLLPLAAGAAGALHLCQSERSSLVSGAASGLLIAASLAPPAALLGMATVIRDWELLPSALFLLGLQLAGINLVGALVFRAYGLRSDVPPFDRGKGPLTGLGVAVSVAGLAALLAWQFLSPSSMLQRASAETRIRGVVMRELTDAPGVLPAQVEVRFARTPRGREPFVLVTAHVQRVGPGVGPDDELRRQLARRLRDLVEPQAEGTAVLVSVTLIDAPEQR